MTRSMASWLDYYGDKPDYRWRGATRCGRHVFCRPLGLTEVSFDADGRFYEGRADMSVLLELEMRSSLSKVDLRERILIAWACLRSRHLLLQAKTFSDRELSSSVAVRGMHFAVNVAASVGQAIEDAETHLVFLEDHYESVDYHDFYSHCLNVGRVVDPDTALAKAFILPIDYARGRSKLRFMFVFAHEISDGLTSFVWSRHFVKFLNDSQASLRNQISQLICPNAIANRLPLPQEALYPKIPGNKARQRWFWAIARILRHVRRPLPEGFSNPLQRSSSGKVAPFDSVYHEVLDYNKTPIFNTLALPFHISAARTQNLYRLAREAKASIGAGLYAFCALTMMEFHERAHPGIPLQERKAFILGFPLNPRAFFNHHTEPDSMMLAFSDGIWFPFLPSHLDIRGRIRLLSRQAQRQLAMYQKRPKSQGETLKRQNLNSRGAGLVLANQYLFSLERAHTNLPETLRQDGISSAPVAYPPRPNPTMQTCGISSVGNRDVLIREGVFDLNETNKDFVADFRDLTTQVRARAGEFLIGIGGSDKGLWCTPSVDGTTMDSNLVSQWRDQFEAILAELDDTTMKHRM